MKPPKNNAVASSYDDVAMMLSANTDNQSLYTDDSKGLAKILPPP